MQNVYVHGRQNRQYILVSNDDRVNIIKTLEIVKTEDYAFYVKKT